MQPDQWLKDQPLKPSEQLFAVFSSSSAVEPLKAWPLNAQMPKPVWAETIYAEWDTVMPYVGIVDAGSEFLNWVATTESRDWGWLAVSSAGLEAVVEHFRSLTQVLMPDGKAVFFRFWDGRHIYPILHGLGDKAGEVLPMFDRYLINGQTLEVGTRVLPKVRDWPWWEVPKPLLDTLTKENPSTLIGNLLQWLEEERPDIYTAWPENNLKLKVTRFVRRPDAPDNLKEALLNHLILEQG